MTKQARVPARNVLSGGGAPEWMAPINVVGPSAAGA